MTGLGVNQHQAGYWIDLVNTKALSEWIGYREALAKPQRHSMMMGTNQGVYLVESGRYASSTYESQARILNNEERLRLINLREAVSFRARMWLVVATRLQRNTLLFGCVSRVIHYLFWWMLYRGLFAYFKKEMRFPSCNFCLKRRLGEPTPFKTMLQFGRAQQPVRINPWLSFTPKEQGVMRNLLGLWRVSFKHGTTMSGQRGVTGVMFNSVDDYAKGCHIRLVISVYVSCVSGFSCSMYIGLNHRDSRIWVIACLVVITT
jgi:hypothetical protein